MEPASPAPPPRADPSPPLPPRRGAWQAKSFPVGTELGVLKWRLANAPQSLLPLAGPPPLAALHPNPPPCSPFH